MAVMPHLVLPVNNEPKPIHPRYVRRTTEWYYWGIKFMDVQPDQTRAVAPVVAELYFPFPAKKMTDDERRNYEHMCAAWIDHGTLPVSVTRYSPTGG